MEKNLKYKYYLLIKPTDLYEYMYKDLKRHETVEIIGEMGRWMSGVWAKIYCFIFGKKVNAERHIFDGIIKQFCKLSFAKYLLFHHIGKKMTQKTDSPICCIWYYNYLDEIKRGMVQYLRDKYPLSKHIYVFTDTRELLPENIKLLKENMHIIGIFDKKKAEEFGFVFYPNCYPNERFDGDNIKYDICFIGRSKGRAKLLHEISLECTRRNIKTAFYLLDEGEEKYDGIQYIQSLWGYDKVRNLVNESKCVLELRNETTLAGCSLRVQEAVVFGKKILTNNVNVYDLPCCKENNRWIHFFEEIKDIDWDFIRTEESINYKYNDEYSAVKWIRSIDEYLAN